MLAGKKRKANTLGGLAMHMRAAYWEIVVGDRVVATTLSKAAGKAYAALYLVGRPWFLRYKTARPYVRI